MMTNIQKINCTYQCNYINDIENLLMSCVQQITTLCLANSIFITVCYSNISDFYP